MMSRELPIRYSVAKCRAAAEPSLGIAQWAVYRATPGTGRASGDCRLRDSGSEMSEPKQPFVASHSLTQIGSQ
jgi:hypothetical protein